MSNLEFWNSQQKTDPLRVKQITGKQYNGHSPQPYYMVRRATEAFGLCGIGWGYTILSERMERMTETDILHIAMVEFWYIKDSKTGRIQHIGETKAAYKTAKGNILVDEDAPKKSVTDALTKCMSYLGFAGDIFSGRWDDSKYVKALEKEFADAEKKAVDDASQLPQCTPDRWAEMLPVWADLVLSGKKTAQQVSNQIRGKYTLTPEQSATLDDLGNAQVDGRLPPPAMAWRNAQVDGEL